MRGQARVRTALRDADRRLPQGLRRGLRLVAGRASGLRRTARVTVVVAGSGAGVAELDLTLHSLRAQEHRNLEVVVVLPDPASPAADVVRRHAAEDWRFVLDRRSHADDSAARDAGASRARGSYLTFVRAGDTLPVAALARLVAVLEGSGSDFAFGRLTQVGGLHKNVAGVTHPAHEQARTAVTLEQFPLAVTDIDDDNRMYRTAFWRDRGLVFADADAGATPALRSFAEARAFDVLVETTYQRRERGGGRPIGALVSAMDDVDEWLDEQARVQRFVAGRDLPLMLEAWALAVCELEALPYLDDAERATPEQWSRLSDFLARTRALMSAETWALVRAESKVKVWLAVSGHRAALESFVAERLFEFGNRRTEVVDGRVLARFEGLGELASAVPDDCYEMGRRETTLEVRLHAARWVDGSLLLLELFTAIDFVSLTTTPSVAVWLERTDVRGDGDDPATGPLRVDLPVEAFDAPEANQAQGHRYQDYSRGAVRVVVDPRALPTVAEGVDPVVWALRVEVEAHGLRRSGGVTSREDRGSAGLLGQPAHAPRLVEGRFAGLTSLARQGVGVRVAAAPRLLLRDLDVEGRRVRLSVDGECSGLLVATHPRGQRTEARFEPAGDGTSHAELALPRPPSSPAGEEAPRRWSLRVHGDDGVRRAIAFPEGVTGRFLPGVLDEGPADPADPADPAAVPAVPSQRPGAALLAARGVLGFLELNESARTLVLDEVTLADRSLRFTGRWVGAVPARWTLSLETRRATFVAHSSDDHIAPTAGGPGADAHAFECTVRTEWDEWGLGVTDIPQGAYALVVTASADAGGDDDVRVLLSEAGVASLLAVTLTEQFRMSLVRWTRSLGVRLTPPLTDDERGPFQQRRLQLWSGGPDVAVDRSAVYFQSYTGVSATDSQRALHDELRRTRPDLTLYWAVAQPSVPVPEGGVPILMHSRRWYEVLGSAAYLVNNIDFDRWFAPKPGQRFLQTFHGYPAKSMGIRLWRAKEFTDQRIERELRRTSRHWDLILTPCPEMDRYYREEYAYDGEIESAGYPRDDGLLAADADEVRDRTRRLLGVGPHQTVVLYAPTWRDDQATNYRSAVLTRHLDLESATARLGEEFVFLMRGHRFHAQSTDRSGRSARLIDVTDYPEINDLILASDAAVLDYSSLRFDFALTGRPMLFLVPDLDTYTGGVRGFLYPFEESAPGPLLEDAEDVVAALRDLPRVQREHAAAYDRFNRTYNYLQDGRAAERVAARFFV